MSGSYELTRSSGWERDFFADFQGFVATQDAESSACAETKIDRLSMELVQTP